MIRINTLKTLVFVTFLVSCGRDPSPLVREFSYDENSGLCKNSSGAVGFNNIDLETIRNTKDCECMKFSKMEMLLVAGDTIKIPTRAGYYQIKGYNFRGAVLDSCNLYFNYILESDLRGANLSTLQYGYAFVVGRVDKFTKNPTTGTIRIVGDSLHASL
jgi:hypothetical protein